MFCCQIDEIQQKDQQGSLYQQSPFKVKLLNALGLRQYAINKLVFARPQPNYSFGKSLGEQRLFIQGTVYLPPFGYTMKTIILKTQRASIPLVHIFKKNKRQKSMIIFSHGNGSDLAQAVDFISSLAQLHEAEYVAYDYTGYGISEIKETTPDSICNDLETVLAWSQRPLNEITLVGFSLGCFPTTKISSHHKVKGVVLLSPMMSLISLLQDQNKLTFNTFFKNDQFNILELIERIQSHILLVHSRNDEIIPFRHSLIIFDRYIKFSKNLFIDFIEIAKIGHNQILMYLRTSKKNKLQKQFLQYLMKTEDSQPVDYYIQKRNIKQIPQKMLDRAQKIGIIKQQMKRLREKREKQSTDKLNKIRGEMKTK